MALKMTVFFGVENYSWSEAIYLTQGVVPKDGFAAATAYMNVRVPLLGQYVNIIAVRISEVPANRFVQDLPVGSYQNNTTPAGGGEETETGYSADRPYSSLLVSMTSNPFTKRMYLAGVPDIYIGVGPIYTEGFAFTDPSYAKLFQRFATLLGSGAYGFRVRSKAGDVQAAGVAPTQGVPQLVQVNTAGAVPGLVAGSECYLSGWRRINTRYQTLNGTWRILEVITPTAPSTLYGYVLANSGNVNTLNFYSPGKIGPLVYNVVAIDPGSVVPVKGVGHKRGGSYGRPVGKSKTRS